MYNIGDYIKIKNSCLCGYILRIKDNIYIVKINNKLIYVHKDLIESKIEPLIKENKTRVTYEISKENINNEIMLRHQNVDEAMFNLDKFIDTMICYNIKRVRIIHGRHGGILRQAVHEYLKQNKNIESYHLADYFEGSIGVTIAILK